MSTTSELATLLEGGSFFEGPRWRDGRWWVSDFYRHRVITVTPDGGEEQVMDVEGQPSGLGWLSDGSLLVVSMKDHRVLRRTADGSVAVRRRGHEAVASVPVSDFLASTSEERRRGVPRRL